MGREETQYDFAIYPFDLQTPSYPSLFLLPVRYFQFGNWKLDCGTHLQPTQIIFAFFVFVKANTVLLVVKVSQNKSHVSFLPFFQAPLIQWSSKFS